MILASALYPNAAVFDLTLKSIMCAHELILMVAQKVVVIFLLGRKIAIA